MKIGVVGAGHMGQWVIRQLAADHEIVAYDMAPVDHICRDRVEWVATLADVAGAGPEVLVNAVSLQKTLALFHALVPLLPKACVIGDLASVKHEVVGYYATTGRPFFSIHPLFGPTFANLEALSRENAIVIAESDPRAKALFVHLFARLGVKVFECTFQEHDAMMAYSLTTPFVATLVFASCVDQTAVPGTTFGRHMKIAKGLLAEDDHLLSEILFNPHSLRQLEQMTSKLEFLKHVIRARDTGEMQRLFAKLRANIVES
ncbi:MAG: prephenate dehydrogenase [Deltaproteobacteria bacterium]|nr:prephenate dehydrogenase [Deltaproteobacteria bacterium]